MMYFEFIKNFLLADSSHRMAVGLISFRFPPEDQKRFIPTF